MLTSTLKNGLRVVSQQSPGHFVSAGAYVKYGSRYEHVPGLANMYQKMFLKGTARRSQGDVQNLIEKLGGGIASTATKETIMLQGSTFKQYVPELVSLFADTLQNSKFDEVDQVQEAIQWELQQQKEKVTEFAVPQLTQQVAYGGIGVGVPQYQYNPNLNGMKLDGGEFLSPDRVLIASVGVEHDRLLDLCQEHFGQWSSKSRAEVQQPSQYVGGLKLQQYTPPDYQSPELKEYTHIQLSFESCSFNDNDVYATSVLQVLLGGGSSFSAGGPGKGMYSRLYMNVLNRYHWVESVIATNLSFSDTGLFTFHATVPHRAVGNMLTVLLSQINDLVARLVKDEELQRAKNQLRSTLFMNMENKTVHVEDIGRQALMKGYHTSDKELSQKIAQVQPQDIQRIVQKMVQSKPTFVLYGETRWMPDFNKFSRAYGLQSI